MLEYTALVTHGRLCVDIVECPVDACSGHGTCHSGTGGYSYTCVAGLVLL